MRNIGGYQVTSKAAEQITRLGLTDPDVLRILNDSSASMGRRGETCIVRTRRHALTIHPLHSALLAVAVAA